MHTFCRCWQKVCRRRHTGNPETSRTHKKSEGRSIRIAPRGADAVFSAENIDRAVTAPPAAGGAVLIEPEVDLVALDRSAGVLSDEHAVALDEYAAAERNDGRVNCDRAAFGQGGAGSGQCQIVAVAFNARIVEGQFIIAKRSGICLDGIACQIRCGEWFRVEESTAVG